MTSFVKNLLLVSVIILIVTLIFLLVIFPEYYFDIFPALPVLSIVVSFFSHLILKKTVEKNPKQFANIFMIITMLKLFIYAGFAFIVLIINKEILYPFSISLLLYYFTYTIFDSKFSLKLVKNNSNR